jgi:aldose 1-epimerase
MITLRAGNAVADVYPEAGGRLGQLNLGDGPILRGPENGVAELGWAFWGSYPLLPWCNRIPNGEFTFQRRSGRVPVNWVDGTAIHGLTADAPWTVVSVDDATVELSIEASEGPYTVTGIERFALFADALEQHLEVVNRGEHRVPVGLGIHPWFRVSEVRVPADLVWPGDPMPTGPPVAVRPDEDLRTPRYAPAMDRCYTGLTGTSIEAGGIRLSWSGPVTQVVVYSAEPGWVCVEPVTMSNNALQFAAQGVPGTGVVGLDPGASLSVDYRFEVTR